MKLSFVVVDSRSLIHPNWVAECLRSLQEQIDFDDYEIVVVSNTNRKLTIGEAFNKGVQEAKGEWVAFVGDDDSVERDLAFTLWKYIDSPYVKNSNIVSVTTNMYAYNNDTGDNFPMSRQWTGAWKRDYLLKYPFNEILLKGIDREYIEEVQKRNDLIFYIKYYHGYYYRRHKDYHCAGDVLFHKEPSDFYFITANRIFLSPLVSKFEKHGSVFVDPNFDIRLAEKAKIVWMEWANEKAIEVSNVKLNGLKVLRIHAFEAFTEYAHKINWNGFDVVIFIDHYIKEYVERQFGKVNSAVVIPNGIDLDKFTIAPNKERNNKIAYAGYLTRKKGIGELLLIAKSLPGYEFHLAGRYQENDIADWMNKKKPDNIFIHEWKYDESMNDFYADKTFILNTSLRESQAMTICEGMASGLKPLVNDWIGADEVYKEEWIYKNIQDLKEILEGEATPERYRDFIKTNYDFNIMWQKIYNVTLAKTLEVV